MKQTRVCSMPVIGDDGKVMQVYRIHKTTGKKHLVPLRKPMQFIIDVCQRCGIGAGVTMYNRRAFQHSCARHQKGDWLEMFKGKLRHHHDEDLCDDCFSETRGARITVTHG